jgi:hypothetical protein
MPASALHPIYCGAEDATHGLIPRLDASLCVGVRLRLLAAISHSNLNPAHINLGLVVLLRRGLMSPGMTVILCTLSR